MTEQVYWIWLSEVLGSANKHANLLMEHCADASAIYEMDREALQSAVPSLSETVLDALCDKELKTACEIEAYCVRHGIGLLSWDNPMFPQRLRRIRSAPVLLYYKGMLPHFDAQLCIGMVGTRQFTEYGGSMAYRFGYELAKCGAVVVSGMARGIDTASHTGALDAGGHTVAVLGCGLDVVYPRENGKLMDEIAKNGTLITEYPPGSQPERHHFPSRNRIISGLCQGVCVVEASLQSGSLITADWAQRQGRDLYVLPGNVGRHGFEGSNRLIKEGAVMVTSAADVLAVYEPLYADTVSRRNLSAPDAYDHYQQALPGRAGAAADKQKKKKQKKSGLMRLASKLKPAERTASAPTQEDTASLPVLADAEEQAIYDLLRTPMSADELAAKSGLEIRRVITLCTMLEINGYIQSAAGGTYMRTEKTDE